MTHEPKDQSVENALLRGALYLTTRALKDYRSAKHTKGEDGMFNLSVPEDLPAKADDYISRANALLESPGRGR